MAGCLGAGAGHFAGMKTLLPVAVALAFAASLPAPAQVIPATPKKFATQGIGDAQGTNSVGFKTAPPQVTVKTTTHIVLGEPRQWKMSDGKFFVGKLIAFEDIVTAGNAGTTPPVVPKYPTVVRDGKARMLVNSKPYEVALERLGPEERKFVEDTRAAIAAKK
jgi:hypothetical protein